MKLAQQSINHKSIMIYQTNFKRIEKNIKFTYELHDRYIRTINKKLFDKFKFEIN